MAEPVENLISPSEHSNLLVTQLNEMMQTSEPNDKNLLDLVEKCNDEIKKLKTQQKAARRTGGEEELQTIDKRLKQLEESVELAQSLRITQKTSSGSFEMKLPPKREGTIPRRRHSRRDGTSRRLSKDKKYPPIEAPEVSSYPPVVDVAATEPTQAARSPALSASETQGFDPFVSLFPPLAGASSGDTASPHWMVADSNTSPFDANDSSSTPLDPFSELPALFPEKPFHPSSKGGPSAKDSKPFLNIPSSPPSILEMTNIVVQGLLKGTSMQSAIPSVYLVATIIESAAATPFGNSPTTKSVASTVQNPTVDGAYVWDIPLEVELFAGIPFNLYACDLQILNSQTFLPFGHAIIPLSSLLDTAESRLSYTGVFENKKESSETFVVTVSLKQKGVAVAPPSIFMPFPSQPAQYPPFDGTWQVPPAPSPPPPSVPPLATPPVIPFEDPSIPPKGEKQTSLVTAEKVSTSPPKNVSLNEFLKNSKNRLEELELAIKEKDTKFEILEKRMKELELKNEALTKDLLKEKECNALIKGETFDKDAFLAEPEVNHIENTIAKHNNLNGKESFFDDLDEDYNISPAYLLNKKNSLTASTQLEWTRTPAVRVEKVINWPPSNVSLHYGKLYKTFAYYRRLLSHSGGLLYEDDAISIYFARRIIENKCVFKIGYKILITSLDSLVVKPHSSFSYGKFTMQPPALTERMLRPGAKFQQNGWIEVLEPFSYPPILLVNYTLSDGISEEIPLRLPLSSLFFCKAAELRATVFMAFWNSPAYAKSTSSLLCTVDPKYLGMDGYAFLCKAVRFNGAFSVLDSLDVGERSLAIAGYYPSKSNSTSELCLARIECGMKGELYGFCRVEARCFSTTLLKALLALVVDSIVDYQKALDWGTHFLHTLE
ncbi:hypothetical protein IE077_004132 [Cardiosporidium cionae]|uniref:Uncharacterized protein n=1 Tax=Cardiosporidium cionae TaxID=476202 RepID=A0ABQ7J6R2_9APIC|nr:hypothetical protein IE077_004132 [Cardiosporidium cionae]|eukprot:KAF8819679.1 hypothetical protein IE077_004132 [Cardiosporidium cionae]